MLCHAPPCPPRPPYLPPLAPGTPGPGGTGAIPLLYGEQRAREGLAAGATSLLLPPRPPSLPLMDAVQGCALFCVPPPCDQLGQLVSLEHFGSVVGNAAHSSGVLPTPAAAVSVLPALQPLGDSWSHSWLLPSTWSTAMGEVGYHGGHTGNAPLPTSHLHCLPRLLAQPNSFRKHCWGWARGPLLSNSCGALPLSAWPPATDGTSVVPGASSGPCQGAAVQVPLTGLAWVAWAGAGASGGVWGALSRLLIAV